MDEVKAMAVMFAGLAILATIAALGGNGCERLKTERFKACVQHHAPLECRAAMRAR